MSDASGEGSPRGQSSTDPLRTVLVGAGRIAGDWQRALAELPEQFVLTGVVDTDPAARAPFVGSGVAGHNGLRELAAAGRPDLAIVCTPPATHEALSIELLQGGVHVLCEKPLAPTEAAAARMFQAAIRAGRLLTMASKFRFVEAVRCAAAMVADGAIGVPVLYEGSFTGRLDMSGRWNSVPSLSGGGVLIDNGAHAVDLARAVLGQPISRVLAHFGRRVQPLEVEDSVRVLFETAHTGCIGTFDLSWSIPRRDPVYARVQGETGMIELGWHQAHWRPHDANDWRPLEGALHPSQHAYDKLTAFRAQLADVRAAIREGGEPGVGMSEAVDSVRVVEAAYRSAMVGKWVPASRVGDSRHV